jgi:hypothetical protein
MLQRVGFGVAGECGPVIVWGNHMKTLKHFGLACGAALALAGCTTQHLPAGAERGRDGTMAYYIEVETSEPGVRIEADGDYVGVSPVKVKLFADPDGTFHNFGSDTYTLKAYPLREGQRMQMKTFRTGKWFQQEDMVPKRVFFDMGAK